MANNEEPSSEGSLQESYYIRVINCIASLVGVGKRREKEFGSVTAREREEGNLPPFSRARHPLSLPFWMPATQLSSVLQCKPSDLSWWNFIRICESILVFLIKQGSPTKLKQSLFFLYRHHIKYLSLRNCGQSLLIFSASLELKGKRNSGDEFISKVVGRKIRFRLVAAQNQF